MIRDRLYKILLSPHVSEKTTRVGDQSNQYVFRVMRDATKREIKDAIEALFEVEVDSVQTVNVNGKTRTFKMHRGKRADWKKAYIRVHEGQNIDFTAAS